MPKEKSPPVNLDKYLEGRNHKYMTYEKASQLYGLLYRMGMSYKNKWMDEENRVYIVYSLDEIQSDMNVSKHKAVDCLAELENVGLIVKRKRGKGLPNQIYVRNFSIAPVTASV